jgi:hypothetical protein
VLNELLVACASFSFAQAVALAVDEGTENWSIRVNWAPHPMENGCLDKILTDHRLEVVTSNGRTVFRSR